MVLVMYLFMFYYSFLPLEKKTLKMASGGELYVELCSENRTLHKT